MVSKLPLVVPLPESYQLVPGGLLAGLPRPGTLSFNALRIQLECRVSGKHTRAIVVPLSTRFRRRAFSSLSLARVLRLPFLLAHLLLLDSSPT